MWLYLRPFVMMLAHMLLLKLPEELSPQMSLCVAGDLHDKKTTRQEMSHCMKVMLCRDMRLSGVLRGHNWHTTSQSQLTFTITLTLL